MDLLDLVNRILIRLPPTGELIAALVLYLLLLAGAVVSIMWAFVHIRIVII